MTSKNHQAYWRANVRLVGALLVVWFVVSYVFGILLKDTLDQVRIGGYGLGFWFAQQGAMYVFLVLIGVYGWAMNRLDKKYDVDE